MAEYTPATDEVRSMFTVGISDPTNPKPVPAREALDGFDRWLAAHDREVEARLRADYGLRSVPDVERAAAAKALRDAADRLPLHAAGAVAHVLRLMADAEEAV